jgi:hypothetical protein
MKHLYQYPISPFVPLPKGDSLEGSFRALQAGGHTSTSSSPARSRL